MAAVKIVSGIFVAFSVPKTEKRIANEKQNNDGKIDGLHCLYCSGEVNIKGYREELSCKLIVEVKALLDFCKSGLLTLP